MTRRAWETYEDDYVRRLYPHFPTSVIAEGLDRSERSVYCRALGMGLHKHPAYYETERGGRTHGQRGGNTRFKKGTTPWNKGTHWKAGGRSAETRFSKGHVPHTWVPVGTERDNGGYLERKVSDTGCTRQDFRLVHVMHWERYRGPVPKDCIIVFRNGDKRDIRIANMELISRAENMRRNSIHNRYPVEVKRAMLALGSLKRVIRNRTEAA